MSTFARLVLVGSAFLLLGASPNGSPKPVRISTGLISGTTDKNDVTAYLGIPFGAPPVGNCAGVLHSPPTAGRACERPTISVRAACRMSLVRGFRGRKNS